MDSTLVTVTVLSMGMAAALSVIVWRLLRDERQRSEARVAALKTRAAAGPARHPIAVDLPLRPAMAAPAAPASPAAPAAPVAISALFVGQRNGTTGGHRGAGI